MALPPLPENNTDRLFLSYQTGGGATAQEHTLSIRYNGDLATPAGIQSDLADVFLNGSNQAQLFTGWSFLRAEVQLAGSPVRLPVPLDGGLAAVVGSGAAAASPSDQAREVRFIGRGLISGRRVSMSLYGAVNAAILENDFRFEPPTPGLLGELKNLALLLGASQLAFIAIDGGQTAWYPYVNWQYNSHWEGEQRA